MNGLFRYGHGFLAFFDFIFGYTRAVQKVMVVAEGREIGLSKVAPLHPIVFSIHLVICK